MRLEKSLFKSFMKGVKEWLPSYYQGIMEKVIIDYAGYNLGFDKEPAYIFDFPLSDEKLKELKSLSNNLRYLSTKNKMLDEELFKKYDSLAGFISIIEFFYKN